MNAIKMLGSAKFLPSKQLTNSELNGVFHLEDNWIRKRTGIHTRYIVTNETIVDLAIQATKNVLQKTGVKKDEIDFIIVATTSTDCLMPGISFAIQKEFDIYDCQCLDILAGCSGYINAFDIARKYIALGEINKALIIGVEVLSKYTNSADIDTAILLGDGAGATILGKSDCEKLYRQHIQSEGQHGEILECFTNSKLKMQGKKIYKYGVTKTVENIYQLLEKTKYNMRDIKYLIPHQSNIRILQKIAQNLQVNMNKLYINIEKTGNTFCASIPIALAEMEEKNLLKEGDKIILFGYGGGLNLGSILLEI